jgi:signal transduction histidine kinase/ligand-binding sensor domain-containing protein
MNKLLVFFLLVAMNLTAQTLPDDIPDFNPHFEVFQLPGGAIANSVQKILQDSTGFIWFGSQGGLHRYDGQSFITYLYDALDTNSLASNYCEDIFLDSKGVLWIAHLYDGGLTSFDPSTESFTRYNHDPDDPESLSSNTNSVITEDWEGNIWVGGTNGLDRLNRKTGKFRRFNHNPNDSLSLSYNQVRALYLDRQGTLWIGTNIFFSAEASVGGLNRFNPETETFTRYMHEPNNPKSLIDNRVRAIFEDSKGNFWVGTSGDGLHLMDREKGTFTRLNYDPGNHDKLTRPFLLGSTPETLSIESHVSSIFEDHEGHIWITAFPGGVNVYNPTTGKTRHFEAGKSKGDLIVNYLWQTFQDAKGVLWLATGGSGKKVFKVRKQDPRFTFFDWQNAGIPLGGVAQSIVKDRKGNIWIGFALASPQLIRYESKTGKTYLVIDNDVIEGSPVLAVNSLAIDREGALWIGTQNGLLRRDPETGNYQRFFSEMNISWNGSLIQDRSGYLWIPQSGNSNGLFRLDLKTGAYINFRHDPSNPGSIGGNFVESVFEDSQGNIYVGGGSGINSVTTFEPLFVDRIDPDGKSFAHLIGDVEGGSAMYISRDKKGNIWFLDQIGSLQKLNPTDGTRKKFSSPNINMTRIYGSSRIAMTLEKNGRIWLYDGNHLFEFNSETEQFFPYVESHGVHSVGSPNSPFHVAFDGEVLIAGEKGILSFYPHKIDISKTPNPPDLAITSFRLLGKRILPGEKSLLRKPIWHTTELNLAHNNNTFAFSVACFDYYDPSANQIEFMLEGYDQIGWRKDLREGETPSYVNVPPGNYIFRVRGADSQGNWNIQGANLKITILPPWWLTWGAYAMYGMLFIGGVIMVDRIQRKRLLAKAHEETREKELMQAREIEKAYEELKVTQAQLIQSEKMASLGELTAGIAHEIQNPLNFVNNFSEVNSELVEELMEEIKKGDMEEAQLIVKDILENEQKIKLHGQHASVIVKGMLEHSRASDGKKELTNINALADEYLRLAYHGFRAKDKSFNADFKTEFDESIPKISIIPQDIGRVLLNLINNAFYAVSEAQKNWVKETASAVKALPDRQSGSATEDSGYQPEVIVSSKKHSNYIEICVKDNGSGIPAEIKDKIFQPFFTTKPTGSGTGLGLSLSYDIVKAHRGDLELETSEQEGSKFYIKLPID